LFQEPLTKTLKDYFKFWGKDLHYDIFTFDDIKPAFVDLLNSLIKFLKKGKI